MLKYYFFILITIVLTSYCQLVIKWKMLQFQKLPEEFIKRTLFLLPTIINPWVLSAFTAAFAGALFWMIAMTKVELSYAYPFVSLSFVLVMILSNLLFGESISFYKILGMLFITTGVIISAYK